MISRFLLAVLALVCSTGLSAAENVAEHGRGQTIIDRGILTTTSLSGVIRLDLATGQLNISAPTATAVVKSRISARTDALLKIGFMVFESTNKAICQGQANNVTTAATLVSNTCTGQATAACTSAMNAFTEAVNALNDCVRDFQAKK